MRLHDFYLSKMGSLNARYKNSMEALSREMLSQVRVSVSVFVSCRAKCSPMYVTSIYTCVCVCVCVSIYEHTERHTHGT